MQELLFSNAPITGFKLRRWIKSSANMLWVRAGLTASVISMLTTAVVLKDGEPLSLAWTTRDHLQSFSLVMFCTISIDLMYGLSIISPVSASISKALSGSAVMMEYSMTLFGDSASSSTACWQFVEEQQKCLHLPLKLQTYQIPINNATILEKLLFYIYIFQQ